MSNPIQNPKIAGLVSNPTPTATPNSVVDRGVFEGLLSDKLKLSAHAATRLQSRNINLDSSEWERVMKGVDRAAAKGSKESLVMLDDVALVVSVKNRTVITAVDKENLKDNVFTNIDSAVIV